MEQLYAWNSGESLLFFNLLVFLAGFLSYFFISNSEKLRKYFLLKFGKNNFAIRWVLFERLLGILFFGLIPAIVLMIGFHEKLTDYGFSNENMGLNLLMILILSPLIVLMNYFNHKSPENLAIYPQIRIAEWNFQILVVSALSWIAYLMAYEFMFRGFLLFTFILYLGLWPALILHICIYSLVHVQKGFKEAVGAIPLGLILGLITIETGNIWTAFVVHVVMALSNEWFSLHVNPEMKFIKKR